MNIREEIRSVLMEVFSEAEPSPHFKDRVHDRLTSSSYTKPTFNYNDVAAQIELIKKINFDPSNSFAVHLKTFKDTFVSKDPSTGKPSIGNEIWAVIRDNTIATIFFRNSHQKRQVDGTDYAMNIEKLKKYYDSKAKAPGDTVDLKTGEFFYKPGKGGNRKRVELDLPMVEIDNNKWYIDEPNEQLIYAKNIKKKVSFDDLKEEILEKVIDAVMA